MTNTVSRPARWLGLLLALAAAVGLGLQLALLIDLLGMPLGPWRWLGFFTAWSNLLALAIGAGTVAGRTRSPRMELVQLVALAGVGLVYSLLLRATWDEQGIQQVAGIILHDVTPLLAAALWWTGRHGALGVGDFFAALLFPAVYLLCATVRAALDGWVPYEFLNPAGDGLALNLVLTMAVFALVAAGVMAIDARLGARRPDARR